MIRGVKFKHIHCSDDDQSARSSLLPNVSHGLETLFYKLTANSVHDLVAVLHNRLVLARPAYRRHQRVFGRLLNGLMWERQADTIEINGIELRAIIELLGESIDVPLFNNASYLVPFVEAESLLERLKRTTEDS